MSRYYKLRSGKKIRSSRVEHQLKVQAEQIDRVFSHREIPTQVTGGLINQNTTKYNLGASIGLGWEKLVDLTQELRSALKVPHIQFDQVNGLLKLSIEHQGGVPVPLLELLEKYTDVVPLTAILGLTDEGRPILLDFDDPEVSHILISGKSGSGKTNLLRSIAISMAATHRQSQLQLIVIDLENKLVQSSKKLLNPLAYLPHMLSEVCQNPEEASSMLEFLRGELVYRNQQGVKSPTLVVLIDNIDTFFSNDDQTLIDGIREILQGGKATGIHLIISCEQPKELVQDNIFRANLPIRLVGETSSELESNLAAGILDSRAEYLLGQGDFLAVAGGGLHHFQAAYVDDYDLHYCLHLIRNHNTKSLLAQPLNIRNGSTFSDFEHSSNDDEENNEFFYDGREIIFRKESE
jgi:S-DNA-T family DNA segregation ATPase FtsK/SpoIIIE